MIAQTHFNHFILSIDVEDEPAHIVLDEKAVELERFEKLDKAMAFCKDRHLAQQAEDLITRVDEQRAQRLAEEEKARKAEEGK